MSNWGELDFSDFEKWAKQLDKTINEKEAEKMVKRTLIELASAVLRRTVEKSPVIMGDLRRGWQIGQVHKTGDYYEIEIFNAVEYAEFVEYGHRQEVGRYVPTLGKRLKQPFIEGQYMLRLSVMEVEELMPEVLEQRLTELIGGIFGAD